MEQDVVVHEEEAEKGDFEGRVCGVSKWGGYCYSRAEWVRASYRILRSRVRTNGPVRAGKSTLLQLLASRRLNAGLGAGFNSSGEILFNGRPVDKNARSQVAFVEQEDDYHLPALTVSSVLVHYLIT